VLSHLKILRGTRLDPFGYGASRREERTLIDWYLGIIEFCKGQLGRGHDDLLAELLRLPENIRGYEYVKSRTVEVARARADELRRRLEI
jgi:indolepyruvate ferredoxin oxidoreductase